MFLFRVTITQPVLRRIVPGVKGVLDAVFTVISASVQALMEWLARCVSTGLV